MKEFQYTIKDACGIHARPAGLLVKVVKSHASTATLEKDGPSIQALGALNQAAGVLVSHIRTEDKKLARFLKEGK